MGENRFLELDDESVSTVAGGKFIRDVQKYSANGHEKGTDWVDENGHMYRIQRGDSMAKIGERFGVNWRMILLCNPQIRNPNLIYVGDVIKLPK